MTMDDFWRQLAESAGLGSAESAVPIGGGCINEGWRLSAGGRSWFVKCHEAARLAMFEAEYEGLRDLRAAAGVRVPAPVATGTTEDRAWLVTEWLDLAGSPDEAMLGEHLARQHDHTADRFGWHRDNTIGLTPQINGWTSNWADFWRDRRLAPQVEMAREKGLSGFDAEGLFAASDRILADHPARPGLLHGDLWGGNRAALADGTPVIFDPATYYGDGEADIAMTELFGRFGADFYAAYDAVRPRPPGYAVRRDLYNLYHVLNHFNMFGGGYGGQAVSLADRLIGEAGAGNL